MRKIYRKRGDLTLFAVRSAGERAFRAKGAKHGGLRRPTAATFAAMAAAAVLVLAPISAAAGATVSAARAANATSCARAANAAVSAKTAGVNKIAANARRGRLSSALSAQTAPAALSARIAPEALMLHIRARHGAISGFLESLRSAVAAGKDGAAGGEGAGTGGGAGSDFAGGTGESAAVPSAREVRVTGECAPFDVIREESGALLCSLRSFARFAGASRISLADGGFFAQGGGYDVSVPAGESYILSSGRAFWIEGGVRFESGEPFVPLAAAARAFGFSLEDDGAGGAILSGGVPIAGADAFYGADSLYWLSRIINAESGGEPMLGKIAVGNVVLNRVRSDEFPDTVYGVIFDRRFGVQFSPTENGAIYLAPSGDAVIAAKICLEGFTLSDEIEYFFNPSIAQCMWISENRPYVMTIANHAFYG